MRHAENNEVDLSYMRHQNQIDLEHKIHKEDETGVLWWLHHHCARITVAERLAVEHWQRKRSPFSRDHFEKLLRKLFI
jgi:hypothetical protein